VDGPNLPLAEMDGKRSTKGTNDAKREEGGNREKIRVGLTGPMSLLAENSHRFAEKWERRPARATPWCSSAGSARIRGKENRISHG